ncbi:MAG TPA: NAD(P)H-dependent oxidoreductase subunit E [Bacteroidales bacterium]|nr:NAD(P)H-dependent oxidoreductase subunit E [Bacteroidales bacterium]
MSNLDKILEKYPFVQRDNLIPILQDIQDEFGYLSEEAIIKVGKYLSLPTAKIFGLASFYHHFRFNITGKYHIKICNGSSCHVNSNMLIIKEIKKRLGIRGEEVTKDGLFSMEETNCIAACGEGPVMAINERYFTHLSIEKVAEIIDSYKSLEE